MANNGGSAGADDDDGVIHHIPEEYHSKTHSEHAGQPVTVLSEEESKNFRPMIWPIMDNGKEKTTNAYGYPTGGWYKDQMDMIYAHRQARRDAEEAAKAEQERHVREALEKEKQEEEITVAKLEDVIKEAHEEGYNAGYEKGHSEGYANGESEGQKKGYDEGFARGSEKGYNDGLLKGQEEGFAQGQAQGLQNGEDIITNQVNRFRRIADMLANPMRQVDRDVTDELVYLVSRLAKVVIKHDVQHDPQFLRESITHALEVLPNFQKGATIFLNEDDLSLVTTLVGREYIDEQHWDLKADGALEHGDLRVTNDISSVEWKLNDRIDELLDTFLKESSAAVDEALREHIDDFPEHDEIPKPLVAPKPALKSAQTRAAEAREAAQAADSNSEEQQKLQEQAAQKAQEKRIADAHDKRKFFKETKEKYGPQAVAALRQERGFSGAAELDSVQLAEPALAAEPEDAAEEPVAKAGVTAEVTAAAPPAAEEPDAVPMANAAPPPSPQSDHASAAAERVIANRRNIAQRAAAARKASVAHQIPVAPAPAAPAAPASPPPASSGENEVAAAAPESAVPPASS